MKRYEQFEHTADIGIRVFGRDMKELFENAAFGLFDLIADLEGVRTTIEETISVSAQSSEELLVSWLDELLYIFCTKEILFSNFEVQKISDNTLVAKAYGRPVSANRNRLKTEIKAITYSGLKITQSDSGYQAEIIFDV